MSAKIIRINFNSDICQQNGIFNVVKRRIFGEFGERGVGFGEHRIEFDGTLQRLAGENRAACQSRVRTDVPQIPDISLTFKQFRVSLFALFA